MKNLPIAASDPADLSTTYENSSLIDETKYSKTKDWYTKLANIGHKYITDKVITKPLNSRPHDDLFVFN
jgi:hypothetical protein